MSVSSMAAKRRMDFTRAASRAASQLLSTGDVSDRTRARLEEGWRSGEGHRFRLDPTAIDSSHIDLLSALGKQGPADYQESQGAPHPMGMHPAATGAPLSAAVSQRYATLLRGRRGMPR